MIRECERLPDVSFAYRARRDIRAWLSVISRDASPSRIYSHAVGDALGHRTRGLPGRAERRACEANLSRGVPLAARYSRHRKSVWEVVQAFGRTVSAKSYNFDGSTASESSPQWRRGFNATLLEISFINAIELPCITLI